MAVEKLGSGQGCRPTDGLELGHHLRGGEEVEEEATDRLHVLQSQAPQLLGVPILLL